MSVKTISLDIDGQPYVDLVSGTFGLLKDDDGVPYYTLPPVSRIRREEESIQTTEEITDAERGSVQGIVRTLSSSDQMVTVTADSALAFFNSWFTVPPYNGTVRGYVQFLMAIAGVTIPLSVDPSIANQAIKAPGFQGNIWDNFRQCAAVNAFEVAQVAERIVVRPWRQFQSYYNQSTTESWSVDTSNTTETVTINWYDMTWGTNRELPLQNLNDESVISVDAGQTLIQQFTVDGSVESLNQPVCLDYVAAGYAATGTSGVYCVAGNDGKPILADRWKNGGGSLSVRTTDNPSVIEVVVVGSSASDYAPFRIAATAGSNDFYNSLHVTGTGFSWTQHEISLHTGAPRSSTAAETTTTLDSRFIDSAAKAYDAALRMSQNLCGGIKSITGSSRSLNRPEDRRGVVVATFQDFNEYAASNNITTFAQFNTWASAQGITTFDDWDTFWTNRFSGELVNQAFGQAIGARAYRGDSWYRVQSTTTDPALVQYTLEMDTTFNDWNSSATQAHITTFEQFNTWYNGLRFMDFNNTPLMQEGA